MPENVWGEATDSDPISAVFAVREWAELAEGEEVRFFPALRLRPDGPAAEAIRRIRVRADEIDRASAGGSAREDAAWLRRLAGSQQVRGEACCLPSMARFAFLTGLHPAYLWPEAEVLTHWGATAAWLGELSRCGWAWMPPEVAEYLADALARDRGQTVWRDGSLTGLAPQTLLAELAAAARRRCAGAPTLVRWREASGPGAWLGRVALVLRRRGRA